MIETGALPTWDELAAALLPDATACRELTELYLSLLALAGAALTADSRDAARKLWSSATAKVSLHSNVLRTADPERVDVTLGHGLLRFLWHFPCRTPPDLLKYAAAIRCDHDKLQAVACQWAGVHRRATQIVEGWADLSDAWLEDDADGLRRAGSWGHTLAAILRPELVGPDMAGGRAAKPR